VTRVSPSCGRRSGYLLTLCVLVVAMLALASTKSVAQESDDSTTTTKRDAPTTTRLETTTTREDEVTTTTELEATTTTKLNATSTTKLNATSTTLDDPSTEGGGPLVQVGSGGGAVNESLPACKQNRVKNPSFESVIGDAPWYVLDVGTTKVPSWTRLPPAQTNQVKHESNPLLSLRSAHDGEKYATLYGFWNDGPRPTLVGELTSPTADGDKYLVSAHVTRSPYHYVMGATNLHSVPAAVEVRLRRSSDGAQSPPLVTAVFMEDSEWLLIGAVITADDAYDRVVLRSPFDLEDSFIDSVRVCRMTATSSGTSKPLVGLGVVVLTGLVLGALWIRRRRSGTSSSIFDRWGSSSAR